MRCFYALQKRWAMSTWTLTRVWLLIPFSQLRKTYQTREKNECLQCHHTEKTFGTLNFQIALNELRASRAHFTVCSHGAHRNFDHVRFHITFFSRLLCEMNDKLESVCVCVVIFTIVHHHIIISVQKPAPSLLDIIASYGIVCAPRKCNCSPSLCIVCLAISLSFCLFFFQASFHFVFRNASLRYFLSTQHLFIESSLFASNK